MSFEDRLMASIRGVEFELDDVSGDIGRRAIPHAYPKREQGYTEDNGRVLLGERITGKVVGTNYYNRLLDVIEAINAPGPCEMIHPWFGVRKIQIGRGSYRLVNREEGVATFSFEVFEVGENLFPTADRDTASKVSDDAEASQSAANDAFEQAYDETATKGIGDMVDQYLDDLDEFTRGLPSLPTELRDWTDRLQRTKDSVGKLLAYPGELARETMGILEDVKSVVKDPIRALNVYDSVANRWKGMRAELAVTGGLSRNIVSDFETASSVSQYSSPAEQQAILANAEAYKSLITTSAAVSKASALSQASYQASLIDETQIIASLTGSERQAIVTGQQLRVIGNQLAANLAELSADAVERGDSALWRSLRQLRQSVLQDTKVRAEQLPQLSVVKPTTTVPVALIAWQETGDTEKRNSIVRRNGLSNPAFVTPNKDIEVING
ncbi:DNA circularization protein [Vibrio hepatarius]|uniref:DNA circularization protein n=1 Tax=Vibrio hepatarius TaxID=171383 RepID=UPI00148D682F|nr:DNA circularization N-terminal domain-containing protein [Vibrio hepatarius]NOI14841.1 multidrug DMT transporter permease [Vibrio hepatarius]